MEAELYQSIPLTYSRLANGNPLTGLNITVSVVDAGTGATLLTTTALSEVSPGHYAFVWSPSISVATHCKAYYHDSGYNFIEYFDIEDSDDTVERSTGKTA